jgi:hypothetical protein
LDVLEYDFQVLSNPNDLKELIFNKNKISNKARIKQNPKELIKTKRSFMAIPTVNNTFDTMESVIK